MRMCSHQACRGNLSADNARERTMRAFGRGGRAEQMLPLWAPARPRFGSDNDLFSLGVSSRQPTLIVPRSLLAQAASQPRSRPSRSFRVRGAAPKYASSSSCVRCVRRLLLGKSSRQGVDFVGRGIVGETVHARVAADRKPMNGGQNAYCASNANSRRSEWFATTSDRSVPSWGTVIAIPVCPPSRPASAGLAELLIYSFPSGDRTEFESHSSTIRHDLQTEQFTTTDDNEHQPRTWLHLAHILSPPRSLQPFSRDAFTVRHILSVGAATSGPSLPSIVTPLIASDSHTGSSRGTSSLLGPRSRSWCVPQWTQGRSRRLRHCQYQCKLAHDFRSGRSRVSRALSEAWASTHTAVLDYGEAFVETLEITSGRESSWFDGNSSGSGSGSDSRRPAACANSIDDRRRTARGRTREILYVCNRVDRERVACLCTGERLGARCVA
ncbi:hypothetical protein C8Q77DRAFT_222801 [Trametes polyzona]|nr:hypothetical protein C8Q77DRAFT_222801 [Trametes polyzona]